ncbi:S-adenosyl-L-methionine-dependent methyltransferase [Atractiella rhizophila]|nr:S-adenosyl-L-methionine-dependent methyltransferase [Atractiella rhizophila]
MPRTLPFRPIVNIASCRQKFLRRLLRQSQRVSPSLSFEEHRESAKSHLRWLSEGLTSNQIGSLKKRVDEYVIFDKPLAYILGNTPFYPLPDILTTRPPILIPRWETEEWANRLADLLEEKFRNSVHSDNVNILEIGSGTGCIPLLLAFRLRQYTGRLRILSVDKNPEATNLANENLHKFSSYGLSDIVQFIQSDIFAPNFKTQVSAFGGGYWNIIVSNPPYISRKDYDELDNSVKVWEDPSALIGSEAGEDDGLQFYRRIAKLVVNQDFFKSKEGWPNIVVEVGERQSRQVCQIFDAVSFRSTCWKDGAGIERVVIA